MNSTMISKFIICFVVQVFIAKSIRCQYLNNGAQFLNPSSYIINSPAPTNTVGIQSSSIASSPSSGCLTGNKLSALSRLAAPQNLLDSLSYGGVLSVSSGSPLQANGISISADNLLIDGAVAVNGNLPFIGSVNVDGNLPSSGQAAISYNAGPGVGITSAGCGTGVTNTNGAGVNLPASSGRRLTGLNGNNPEGLGGPTISGLRAGTYAGTGGINIPGLNGNQFAGPNGASNLPAFSGQRLGNARFNGYYS